MICRRGALVIEDAHVRVTAAKVPHPPLALALAYRFDAADRSIVVSGDTREFGRVGQAGERRRRAGPRSDARRARARDARGLPNRDALARSVIRSPHDRRTGRTGRERAGVKMLVLSHLFRPKTRVDEEWLAGRAIIRAGDRRSRPDGDLISCQRGKDRMLDHVGFAVPTSSGRSASMRRWRRSASR